MASAFPSTHWSRLADLRGRAEEERQEVLGWFARRYWRSIFHYVWALRRRGADDAEDVTQQFFASLLERGDLDGLSPERGSVRGFLKVALRNFVANLGRTARRRPRLFPLTAATEAALREPSLPPDDAFDAAWARQVLDEALQALRRQLRAED